MGYGGKPPPGARRVRFLSLHDDDETIVFTFSALLLFGGRLYSPRVFSRYYYSHPNKQQRSSSSPSPSSSSAPFVRSERAREEKRHKTTTHKHRRKKSLRVAFSVQITRIENAFYFCFLLFRVFVSEKSLNPKPTRIFFPHRGEKCKILLSVCIFIFRTRKHTRTIIHNKYDFCSHFHNRSRRCRVFCV